MRIARCTALWAVLIGGPLWAQSGFQLPSQFQGLAPPAAAGTKLTIFSEIQVTPDGRGGQLSVIAKLGSGWHIYSLTQQAGGPMRTEILLEPSKQFELAGDFTADSPPKIKRLDFYDVPVEEHAGEVTWSAPIRIAGGVPTDQLEIKGKLAGQICDDSAGCIPLSSLDTQFVARVTGVAASLPYEDVARLPEKRRTPPIDEEPAVQMTARTAESPIPSDTRFVATSADGFRPGTIHAAISGQIEPANVTPGGEANLVITAKMDSGWHVYAYAEKNPDEISQPTLIAVVDPPWSLGKVRSSEPPIEKETGIAIEPVQRYHEGQVSWTIPIKVPATAKSGATVVQGMIGYQTCSDSSCDRPVAAFFSTQIDVGSTVGGVAPLRFAKANYATVNSYTETGAANVQNAASSPAPSVVGDFDLNKIHVDDAATGHSILYVIALAFVGGFLLNFMPCVLPVIGLKIMSFVQQAGEQRGRVLVLNVMYALGMLSVFWLLAVFATFFSLGWGEQYNNTAFTITLLCVVFVMGLSLIGVWEIPIPGFVGSGKANELAQQEGLAGAFSKGILTTVLATPCSGPGVAAAITWTTNKPSVLIFLVFTCMGLGMSLPYLLIGAFPSLVRFVPKPGPWMNTFKQTMGFVLMGTVVYLFTLIDTDYFIPTLAFVFALWAACWWIGRIPITADSWGKAKAWIAASMFAALVGWFGFGYEPNRDHDLPWEDFSLAALDRYVKEDRTVLVDFTADWCPTCKVLERTVLNTRPIRQLVDKNEVVTLVADWSKNDDPEIEALLRALGSAQLPVIAIFPAGEPYRPTKLTGGYTRARLLEQLRAAGPSLSPRLASDSR